MKRTITIFLICILALLSAEQCSAEVLFGKEYYEELRKHIAGAESSILVGMYLMISKPEKEEDPINRLLDDLIEAKKRGVAVKVVLEDSRMGVSLAAYNKLKENGIQVYPDVPGKLLHLKAAVIDRRYVFLGSANWTRAAMEDNREATNFSESEGDAQKLTDLIESATLEPSAAPKYPGVSISSEFLLSPEKGRIFITTKADKQFDLYLLLLKCYAEGGEISFKADWKELATEMGYVAPENPRYHKSEKKFYYNMLYKTVKGLEQKGYIDYKNGIVTLKPDKAEKDADQSVVIPFEYWKHGYDRKLSHVAKYMYLISLYEANRSAKYPYWSHSQEDMAKLYGISRDTVSDGFLELERVGLIEVIRSKARGPDFSIREVNTYKLLMPNETFHALN